MLIFVVLLLLYAIYAWHSAKLQLIF